MFVVTLNNGTNTLKYTT